MDLSSVVTSVLGQLANLTLNQALSKASELKSVRAQVVTWQAELELIQGKLKDVQLKDNRSNTEDIWMNQLREVANKISNVIKTFQNMEEDKSKGFRKIRFKVWKKPLQLNDLSAKIGSITQTLKMLKEYSPQPGIQLEIRVSGAQVEATTSGSGAGGTEDPDPVPLPLTPTNKLSDIDDPEVVGLDSDKRRILEHLLDDSISRRTILSIVGLGGLGKTTLAQKIYNSSELEGRFQCHIWLTISQKFSENNILREILYSIKPEMKHKNSPKEDMYLVTEIKRYLNDKRYLIILDDVWDTELWNRLKKALPDANNGSRVIITTRSLNVARAADHNTKPYKLGFLKNDESVSLLFRTALQRVDNYPPDLNVVAQKLIKKCGGLPLALIVLGGILSMEEETAAAWDLVYKTMNWHDEDVKMKCINIIAMSYEALPHVHLKHCFLYFGAFPEDYNISAKQMTRMWVADELIPGAGSLEDRAERYMQELVKRCLIQVTEKDWNGNYKYCRIHDLLRDLAIHKAKEINFFTIFSKEEGDGGNQQIAPNRVVLQSCTPRDYGILSTNTRSLLCFGKNWEEGDILLDYIASSEEFKQLKVLLFEHIHIRQDYMSCFKKWLEGLVHLRYLGFRHFRMQMSVQSISFSGLKSLETFHCFETRIHSDSDSLWEIPTLRHIITDLHSEVHWPLNLDESKNLQTLKWVRIKNGIPKLECAVNLRSLKIRYLAKNKIVPAEEGWRRLQALLSRAEHLVSFAIFARNGDVPFMSVGTRELPCHEKIQSLYLYGVWAQDVCVPSVEMFPKYLTKLKLGESWLWKDPMPILERLQCLRILHLLSGSYMGTKMICSNGGFRNLHRLKLKGLKLSEWKIEEGAMPVLSHLQIHSCDKLDTLPELQNVLSLQELIVTEASVHLHKRSQAEDRHKIEYISSVHITMGSKW